jgi:hypothetical protein
MKKSKRHTYVSSFFTRFPFEIRAIVYSYLDLGDLPPLTPGFPSSIIGFISSCQQAKLELKEVASQQLQKYLADFDKSFRDSTGIETKTTNYSGNSDICLVLPMTAFEHPPYWDIAVLSGLHRIFSKYFDTVRIHVNSMPLNLPGNEASRYSEVLGEWAPATFIENLLREIATTIWSSNHSMTIPNKMGVRRICMTWDLRSSGPEVHEKISLSGELRRTQPRKRKTMTDIAVVLQILKRRMIGKPSSILGVARTNQEGPLLYYLRDPQQNVGEMGLVSRDRWPRADAIRVQGLFHPSTLRNRIHVSSTQFAGELKEGKLLKSG